MKVKKNSSIFLLSLALSGCVAPNANDFSAPEVRTIETTRRISISSDGDFSSKLITGTEFNRIISKKIEDGTWKGYIVHSQTYGPYKNTWTKNGLLVPSTITSAGRFQVKGYMEGLGSPGVSSKDMAGWYGFHVDRSETTKRGNYVGANAFGVKADVEILNTRGAEIVFGSTQLRENSMDAVWPDIDVIGPLPADINLNDLRIEYLARITGIGNKDYAGSNAPTLTNPTDTTHEVQIYKGELIAARLINAKSKIVYPVRLEWVFRTRDAFAKDSGDY